MSTKNLSLIFKKIPPGVPVPGEHIAVEDRPIELSTSCPEGHILLSHLYASIDPYMRGRLRDPSIKSYTPAYTLNEPISGGGIAKVLKSTSAEYSEGDIVVGGLPIAQYSLRDVKNSPFPAIRKLTNPYNLTDLRLFLGPLGMPGLTAYSSLYEIGKPAKGQTIFISSAAGAVGQLVGQLSRHEGMTVIGSVGSDEKLDYITQELGFDAGFNYKKESAHSALQRLAPHGIDIYYENVGGEQLEAAINAMNNFGRIVACGMIAEYSVPYDQRYGVKNLFLIVTKRITMRGFIVGDPDMGPKHIAQFQKQVGGWIQDGTFRPKIDEMAGIQGAAQAFVGMLSGKNFGKAVIDMEGKE